MKNNPFRDSPKKPFYQDDQDDDYSNEYERLNEWFDRDFFRPNFFHTK